MQLPVKYLLDIIRGRKFSRRERIGVGLAFLLGVIVTVIQNRDEVALILGHFSALWSIEQNRVVMLFLLLLILRTGVVAAVIIALCCLAYNSILRILTDEPPASDTSQEKRRGGFATTHTPVTVAPPSPTPAKPFASLHDVSMQATHPISVSKTHQTSLQAGGRPLQVTNGLSSISSSGSGTPGSEPLVDSSLTSIMAPLPTNTGASLPDDSIERERDLPASTRDATAHETAHMTSPESEETEDPFSLSVLSSDDNEQHENDENREAVSDTTLSNDTRTVEPPLLEIWLLKSIRMTLYIPRFEKRYPIDLRGVNTRAQMLLAYIAALQGQPVKLDMIKERVFGTEETSITQLNNAFSKGKRAIRRALDVAIAQAKNDLGEQVVTDKLDVFARDGLKMYVLSKDCQVIDLTFVEQQHRVIQEIENGSVLIKQVPEHIKHACDALIAAYKGDFIEDVLANDPAALDHWSQNWARDPFTRYRDYYLQALLYAGEYERKAGDEAESPFERRNHYEEAARLFVQGALAVCNARVFVGHFDTKVFFAKPGRRAGQHVILSEQFIRRALVLYGRTGNTVLANKAFGDYQQQMLRVSSRTWTASPETEKMYEDVVSKTGAYQFPETVTHPYDLDLGNDLFTQESA